MQIKLGSMLALVGTFLLGTAAALAQTQTVIVPTTSGAAPPPQVVRAPMPPVVVERRSPARIIPFYGTGALTTDDNFDSVDEGSKYGLLFDLGSRFLSFETGIVGAQDAIVAPGGASADYWGIPLALKWNMSGNPNSTIFLKAGTTLIDEQSEFLDRTDLLGELGLGGHIPLGSQRAALVLEADYQALMTRESFAGDFQGWAFFAGISFNM